MKLCIKESYPEQELYAVVVLDESEFGQSPNESLTLLAVSSLLDAENLEAELEYITSGEKDYDYGWDEDYDDYADFEQDLYERLYECGIVGVYVVPARDILYSDTWDRNLIPGYSVNVINKRDIDDRNIIEIGVPNEFK